MLRLIMFDLIAYVDPQGHCPYEVWFNSLDAQAAARVKKATDRMEAGNFGDHKGVGGGVQERRLDFGAGYRLYYGRDGDRLVILLAGGTKRRQSKDIEAAKASWQEYKQQKKERKP